MGFFKISGTVLKSMFKKPATLMYPKIQKVWHERTRGSIGIVNEACILCGICVKKCPTDALLVSRSKRQWIIVRMQCIQCGSCIESCPKKCLFMRPDYTEPYKSKVIDYEYVPEQPKPKAAEAAE